MCSVATYFRLMYVQYCYLSRFRNIPKNCDSIKNLAPLLLHNKPSRGFDYSMVVIDCFVDVAIVLKQRNDSLPSFQVSQGRSLEERGMTAMRHGIDNFMKQ